MRRRLREAPSIPGNWNSKILSVLWLILFFLLGQTDARLVHVAPAPFGAATGNGSSVAPYDSVKRGIAEAVDGDTVLLEDGRYHEHNIHLYSKKIVLGSRFVLDGDTNHVNNTIIDGDSTNSDSGSVFAIIHPSDTTTKLVGFTISRGTGTNELGGRIRGGAVYFIGGTNIGTSFRYIIFFENSAEKGGAVCWGSSRFFKCTFQKNRAEYGAVFLGGNNELIQSKAISNHATQYGGFYDFACHAASGNRDCDKSTISIAGCIVINNESERDGGAFLGGEIKISNSIFYNNKDFNDCNFCNGNFEIINSIISGSFKFVSGSQFKAAYSFFQKEFPEASIGGTNIFGIDPRFVSPDIGSFHLLPNSPAIDAGHPDSSYANEPSCGGKNTRIDIGAYGNTPEATCKNNNAHMAFIPATFPRTFLRKEIRFDTLYIVNTNADPMVIHGLQDIVINDPDLKATGISKSATAIGLNETCLVYLRFSSSTTQNKIIPIQINFDADNAGATVNYSISMPGPDYDSLFSNHWDFSYSQVNIPKSQTFYLKNRGSNPLRIDSLGELSPYFAIVGPSAAFTIAAGDSQPVQLVFTPPATQPYQTRLYLHSPDIDAIDSTLILSGVGVDAKDPIAKIDSIFPNPVIWGQKVSVLGKASDQDGLGNDPQIAHYRWVIGRDTLSTSNLVEFPSDKLSMGWNRVSFQVRDNEGVWSAIVVDSIRMLGLSPKVDSIWAGTGLILTSDASVTLRIHAEDRDEFAKDDVNDGDIQKVAWFSTLQGKLGEGRDFTMQTSKLALGLHGIYARVWDNEGDSAVSDTLRIPVQTAIGRAVLVAGTAFDDYRYFFQNISSNLNWAYQRLTAKGFTDEQIYYLNPVGWQSLGDPYKNSGIVDEIRMTKALLHSHLQSLKKDAQNKVPILLYFLGHGAANQQNGKFYLSPTEYLTPDTLSAWLDEWGDLDPTNSRIIVVLDFCYSGSFLPKMRTAVEQNRIVITSADENSLAYFSGGKSFGWNIFEQIHKGRNLKEAFLPALDWSDAAASANTRAHPQLNADNNSRFNEDQDFARAEEIYVSGSRQFQDLLPSIETLQDTLLANRGGPRVQLRATVKGDVDSLWFQVMIPGFGLTALSAAPTGGFSRQDDSTWIASWDGPFSGSGAYLFLVGGKDASGKALLSRGQEVMIGPGIGLVGGSAAIGEAALRQNTPNPFRGWTSIAYFLPEKIQARLEVVDLQGKRVKLLKQGPQQGSQVASWDGSDEEGRKCPGGVYLCRLWIRNRVLQIRMLAWP